MRSRVFRSGQVLQEGRETRIEREVMVVGKEEVTRAGRRLDAVLLALCSLTSLVGSILYYTIAI
jgi:phage terminase large subunit-like protein